MSVKPWREIARPHKDVLEGTFKQSKFAAGERLTNMLDKGVPIRQLAHHRYNLCGRKEWAEEARSHNELIGSWHAIVSASHEVGHRGTQTEFEI